MTHPGTTRRATSFGAVASTYERYRLGYPDELVQQVLSYAGRPVATALEIGAGTGKATRAFAAHGVAVTATDPDEAMLAELRRHVPPSVPTVCGALEDLDPRPTYDLVLAAASLHWTEPTGRWPRIAELLVPGGVFACFGAQLSLADADLEAAVDEAGSAYLPVGDVAVAPPDGTPPDGTLRWPGTELVGSDHFTDVRQSVLRRRPTLSAREYVGHLSTVSAYLLLPAADRDRVLGLILDALPEQVVVVADLDVHLARRSS